MSRLALHLHPRMVPARTLAFTHTYGLGGMCTVLMLLLIGMKKMIFGSIGVMRPRRIFSPVIGTYLTNRHT